jgi:hypothetical protein
MNEAQMKAIALGVTAEIVRAHATTENEKRALTKALPGYLLVLMQEVRETTVEEIAMVIERADPPEDTKSAPRCFAGAIRSTFWKKG